MDTYLILSDLTNFVSQGILMIRVHGNKFLYKPLEDNLNNVYKDQ